MTNPYKSLPAKCFWRTGVAEKSAFEIDALYSPKYFIGKSDKIVTAGSCFAQHFSRALVQNGYVWYNGEKAPNILSDIAKKEFNYGVFSFRTGNIYTPALLLQWLNWAFGIAEPSTECWERNGRYYDPVRPLIEPNGFESPEEMINSRHATLKAIKRTFENADVFVFTMGLTEAWFNIDTGLLYAACPGTLAGTFNENKHKFINYDYEETKGCMDNIILMLKEHFPKIRILLTVSPVPLTASAESDQHIILSTTYSKSVLRAVAGKLASNNPSVDYFPSYEVITSTPFKGMFFAPNQRTVVSQGVDTVMSHFFSNMSAAFPDETSQDIVNSDSRPAVSEAVVEKSAEDIACEELVLEQENAN
ncbi:MAG: hypothetical protein ACI85O_001785 [Saprospiraceae bacterium]